MPDLTPREQKFLKWICDDKTNVEIAVKLGLSLRQTEKIKSSIYLKTRTKSNVSLLKWAVLNKLYIIKKR